MDEKFQIIITIVSSIGSSSTTNQHFFSACINQALFQAFYKHLKLNFI